VNGCDSVVTAHIVINYSTTSQFNDTACNTLTLPWLQVVTTSGSYNHTYQTVNGCDSVVTAHIVINYGTHNATTQAACATYTWNGTTYNQSGTYTYAYSNASGCASVDTLHLTINALPTTPSVVNAIQSRCGNGTVTFSVNVVSGITYTWYDASTGGTLLATGLSFTTPSISQNTSYYLASTNNTTGCVAATRTTVNAVINALPTATAVNGSRCGTGTVSISATVASGVTVDWYAAASGGTTLSTGSTTFTTPSLTTTTTYYAEARNTTTGCLAASRVAVTATVGGSSATVNVVGGFRCGAGTVTLTANAGVNDQIDWYAAATGGTALATNTTTFTTPSISATTVYYVAVTSSVAGCSTSTRVADTAKIFSAAITPSISGANSFCSGSATVLNVTGGNALTFNNATRVDIPNNTHLPSTNSPYTLEMWVKTGSNIGRSGLIGWGDWGSYRKTNAF
jgi:hypothetical protein